MSGNKNIFSGIIIKIAFVYMALISIKLVFSAEVNSKIIYKYPGKSLLYIGNSIKEIICTKNDIQNYNVMIYKTPQKSCHRIEKECINFMLKNTSKIEIFKKILPTSYHQGEYLQIEVEEKNNIENLINQTEIIYLETLFFEYMKIMEYFSNKFKFLEMRHSKRNVEDVIDELKDLNYKNFCALIFIPILIFAIMFLTPLLSGSSNKKHITLKTMREGSLFPLFESLRISIEQLKKVDLPYKRKFRFKIATIRKLWATLKKLFDDLKNEYECPISYSFTKNPFVISCSNEIFDLDSLEQYYRISQNSLMNIENQWYLKNPATNERLKEIIFLKDEKQFILQESKLERVFILEKIQIMTLLIHKIYKQYQKLRLKNVENIDKELKTLTDYFNKEEKQTLTECTILLNADH